VKVLLVQPPIEDFYDTSIRTYPLGLAYIASRIRDICDVEILDCRTGFGARQPKNNDFPELAPFYRDDRQTPFSLFRRYSRYGMGRKEIGAAIREAGPDVVAIASSFTAYSREAREVAAIAKEVDGGIVTVMGGTHATLFPAHVLGDGSVDYCVRGEGETPFFEFIRALASRNAGRMTSVPGLTFRRDGVLHVGGIHIEENIDLLPARDLLPAGKYRIGKSPYTFFLTSRGCPFQCSFCGKPPVPYRRRTVGAIEKELSEIERMGIAAIDFEDDMLNLDIPFFHRVLDLMKGRGFTLSAMNGLYSHTLDAATLVKMREAGFSRLNFSLVDTSPALHARQRRKYPANFLGLLDWLESSDFLIETHFIVGLPGQTPAEIVDTMVFLMGKRMLPGPSIYYPAPGSPLFDEICGSDPAARFPATRSSVMFQANPLFRRETTFTFMKLLRFMNVVKALIDVSPGASTLSDLARADRLRKNPRDLHIFSSLLEQKRFLWFDTGGNDFVEEPQDAGIVVAFFKAMEGKIIKGFRTSNSVRV
jgi:hypothetical protein